MKNVIKTLSISLALVLFSHVVFSQTNQIASSKYSRNSISVHFVQFDSNNPVSQYYLQEVKIPDKFDDNSIGNNLLSVNIAKSKINQDINSSIIEAIQKERIPNDILRKILIDENGVPTIEILAQRGEYSATDAELIKAKNSKEGLSILRQNGIENMLKNVYMVVFDTYDVSSRYYKGATTYTLSFKSYLYKIDLDSLLKSGFWDTFWWEGENAEKLSFFKNFDFPVKLVASEIGNASINTKNTGSDVFPALLDETFSEGIRLLSRKHDPLNVKTTVFSTHPITSKIGKKEGVRPDDLYKVLENRQNKNGETFVAKMGHVRANKVFDNRVISTGKSGVTTFYKATARSVQEGMVLREVPEKGIIVGTEIAYNFDYEYVLPIVTIDYVTHAFKGNRISVSVAYDQYMGFLTFAEIKQDIQINHLSIVPSIGYVYNINDDLSGYTGAIKLGFNFGRYLQLNVGPRALYDGNELLLFMSAGIRLFGF